jgi:outer membrane protein assembly factor BamB
VRRHLKSSLANATPATDGTVVVVLFGTMGVLAAYDFDGRERWRQDVGVLDCNDPQSGTAEWGHASSPVLWNDLVVVQGDRRRDSFLAAYRLKDGTPAWRVARDETSTWSTPNVVRGAAGDELVTNGRTIRAYDPANGTLLWTLRPNSEVVVSTPHVGDGVVYVTAGYPPVRPVYAVRAGHRGDLTLPEGARSSAAVAWSHERGGTYIPSPLLYRGHFYTLNNNGIFTCYRADTGAQAYQTRLGGGASSFSASPVAADGRIYVASETGEVYVLRAGPEQELLLTNAMDEVTMATPAISDGLLLVRTAGHLVGLADPPRAASR